MDGDNLAEIIINKGDSYKIKIEKIESFNKSIFNNIYTNAANCSLEIIKNTKKYHQALKDNTDNLFVNDIENFNNIIAFTGDRGTGKSSAMISFIRAMQNFNENNTKIEQFKSLSKSNYVFLDIIDPSMFEDEENIFGIIVSKMFSKFKECNDDCCKTIDENKKRELIKSFDKVYQNIKTLSMTYKEILKENEYSETSIETLSKLASGSNMRTSFLELVSKFLCFFCENEKIENSFLIIAIDDLDMNVCHAERMIEQIRKYLIVPNVIVVMAIKTEQLINSVEQEYIENYKTIIDKNQFTDVTKNMAEKYIAKLIPYNRRLTMPKLRVTGKDILQLKIDDIFEKNN